jgi:hypothetical protein
MCTAKDTRPKIIGRVANKEQSKVLRQVQRAIAANTDSMQDERPASTDPVNYLY